MFVSLGELKETTKRFVLEAWGKGNINVLDEICSPAYKLEDGATLQDLKNAIIDYRSAMPDFRGEIGDIIAEGNLVAYPWSMHGTHTHTYHGIPATGKQVTFTGITILRFADGKIVADQFQSSSPSFEQQVADKIVS